MSGPVTRLFEAFTRLDSEAMAACYSPSARFSDPVFDLGGSEIGRMWAMLCKGAAKGGFQLPTPTIEEDPSTGSAHWEPRYVFAATGRPVHNVIDSRFELSQGLIVGQRDSFDFWRWSRQALGPIGLVAGWTPMLRAKVAATAHRTLDRFED